MGCYIQQGEATTHNTHHKRPWLLLKVPSLKVRVRTSKDGIPKGRVVFETNNFQLVMFLGSAPLFIVCPRPQQKKRGACGRRGRSPFTSDQVDTQNYAIWKGDTFSKTRNFWYPFLNFGWSDFNTIYFFLHGRKKHLSRSWTFQQVILYMWRKKTPKNLQQNLNSPIHLFPSLLLSGGSSSINLKWGIWLQIGSPTHVVSLTWSLSFKKPS